MYIDLELRSQLQPYVRFDWRLVAERGLRCYGHLHRKSRDWRTVAHCELCFLIKMSREEQESAGAAAPQLASSATRRAGQFKCVGAIRKAGFLSVKKWLLKRRQSIELARKQGWKRYWVCLRGTALLFHSVIDSPAGGHLEAEDGSGGGGGGTTDLLAWIRANCCASDQNKLVASLMSANHWASNRTLANQDDHDPETARHAFLESLGQCYIEREPRHLIIIEGAIVQPIPEHPKRDHVFCLSTTFGDAYLFQASCQLESDNWISAMHNACAASLARDLTRDEAMKLFEAKVRHLELEAEKKLFLRQRLESRLTTMNSIGSSIMTTSGGHLHQSSQALDPPAGVDEKHETSRTSLRRLLQRLNQQLVALDTYLEQVHCEIYQLRCYLCSCGAQQMFYQQQRNETAAAATSGSPAFASIELPHPRSLLMHVSKATKLLLIKLGVFTVSSFHAYIHARQGSAETILQRLQSVSQPSGQLDERSHPKQQPLLELRLNAQSISDRLLTGSRGDRVLETDTEQLIHLANLRAIDIRLTKHLYKSLAHHNPPNPAALRGDSDTDSSRHTIQELEDSVIINLKLHSSSTPASIIKQVLKILRPPSKAPNQRQEFAFLSYYLRLKPHNRQLEPAGSEDFIVCKRRETLADWNELQYLELREKVIFRLQLTRRRLDEEASPFGIAVGAELHLANSATYESQLNVYCSYIEWGSVADKAGLRDDDELLVLNGVPVQDLDMMFVECILQDEQSLRLVVRSCRTECPASAEPVPDDSSWRPPPSADDGSGLDGNSKRSGGGGGGGGRDGAWQAPGGNSQVISDEYISSLVCPPPPAKSDAFLRTLPDSSLLVRQKSDMSQQRRKKSAELGVEGLLQWPAPLPSAKSEQDLSLEESPTGAGSLARLMVDLDHQQDEESCPIASVEASQQLAGQLLRKTDQLTRLLASQRRDPPTASEQVATNETEVARAEVARAEVAANANETKIELAANTRKQLDPNCVERLRKSILELLETEYAFIRHLETISDHYMCPLEESSFLCIPELRLLSQSVLSLISFQRDFFDKLTSSAIWGDLDGINIEPEQPRRFTDSAQKVLPAAAAADDDSEELNKIVQQLEMFKTIDHFKPLILSLAKTFVAEADRFKIYAAYCVAYSRLQKFLHPKRGNQGSLIGNSSPAITSVPIALDTFLTSSGAVISANGSSSLGPSTRDFFKPLGSFMTSNNNSSINLALAGNQSELGPKLRQLSEFLGNLDSSSSSASLSLPKTSNSEPSCAGSEQQVSQNNNNNINNYKRSPKNSSAGPFQRSVHQQNFESYLIKPIQRIVKYPMLLSSIALSAQIYQDQELNAELQVAVKQMGSATSYVNDAQRVHDEYGLVFEHIERQFRGQPMQLPEPLLLSSRSSQSPNATALAHQPPISLAIGQLLYFGPVAWLNISELAQSSKLKNSANLGQMLFVFESCVVFICKEQVSKTVSSKKRFSSPGSSVTNNFSSTANNNTLDSNGSSNSTTTTTSLTTSIKAFPHQKSTITAAIQSNSNNNNSNINNNLILDQSSSSVIRYQTLIPVSEVQVRSVPTTTTTTTTTNHHLQQHQFQWELFRCSSVNSNSSLLTKSNTKRQTAGKVYLLSCANNETRNAFLRKIRYIIRESVRNMSLPLARSPSTKSLTPKKISSPSLATNTNSSCSTSLSPVCNSGDHCGNPNNNNKSRQADGCEFGANQVCDSSYKTSIQVNN